MLSKSVAMRQLRVRPVISVLPVVAAALCAVLPLAPWTARNWRTFHVFQPLAPRYANDPGEMAPLGFARWYRTWALEFASTDQVYWNLNGDRIDLAALPQRAFDAGSPAATQTLRSRTASLLADYNDTCNETPAIDARFAALAAEHIRAHPILSTIGLPMGRLLDMALRPRIEMMPLPDIWWKPPTPPRQTAFAAAYAALNFAYFLLALAGLRAWRRRGWAGFGALAWAMAAAVVLRLLLLLTLDNSEPRYTLELFPVLLVWAGAVFASPPAVIAPRRTAVDGG